MSRQEDWPDASWGAHARAERGVRSPGRGSPGGLAQLGLALLAGAALAVLIIVLIGRGAESAPRMPGVTGTSASAPAESEVVAGEAADESRPRGLPVTRDDWVITKDYAAHGGLKPHPQNNQGAVDVAFLNNKDAFGADVVATHSGKVKLLSDDPTYGNLVYVFGDGFTTTYGHLQEFTVKEGDVVRRGQVIGRMGSTGVSSGPHVDYQVWQDGVNRNPMDYCDCSGTEGPGARK